MWYGKNRSNLVSVINHDYNSLILIVTFSRVGIILSYISKSNTQLIDICK